MHSEPVLHSITRADTEILRLGPLWAQASTAPSRLFKCYPSQGGILVPCVIKPPAHTFLPDFAPGSMSRSFTTVMDFAPTFLDLAGVTLPPAFERMVPSNGPGDALAPRKMTTFRGRDVHAMRGKSWLPQFAQGNRIEENEMWAIHSSSEPVGWELFARGALRKGDWKIVHIHKKQGGVGEGDEGWELFDVVQDPGETKDLALEAPEKLEELRACWEQYVAECGVVWGATAVAAGLSKEEAPDYWQDELELQAAWMGAKAGCPTVCT